MTDIVRPRRLTGEQRQKRIQHMIASGEVADPKIGPESHQDYSNDPDRTVIEVPLAKSAASETKE